MLLSCSSWSTMFNVVGYCWNTGPRFVSTRFVLRFNSSRFDSKQNPVHVWVGSWRMLLLGPPMGLSGSIQHGSLFAGSRPVQFLICSGLDSWFDLVPSCIDNNTLIKLQYITATNTNATRTTLHYTTLHYTNYITVHYSCNYHCIALHGTTLQLQLR